MIFQVINPPKFESVKDILENAMIQQNVDKPEDLKWIVVHKIKTYCMECDREMTDSNMMICSDCRRQD